MDYLAETFSDVGKLSLWVAALEGETPPFAALLSTALSATKVYLVMLE